MKSDLIVAVLLTVGGYFSLKKGLKENDHEGYFSINIRFIGAGLTMLVVAIVLLSNLIIQ